MDKLNTIICGIGGCTISNTNAAHRFLRDTLHEAVVKEEFDRTAISLPYPQRDIYLYTTDAVGRDDSQASEA